MDTFYTAYTKVVNGKTFYFVKKFSTFPELKNVPNILENYGMHIDFRLACKIAQVNDPAIMQKLLSDIERPESNTGKVIHMNSHSVIRAAQ